MNRRTLAAILLLIVAAGVVLGIVRSNRGTGAAPETASATSTIPGAVGSEKAPLLADPEVVSALAKSGFSIRADKLGSREIVTGFKAGAYEFGWPSGSPAAAELKKRAGGSGETTPFYTPMVVATWGPIADILQAEGIVSGTGRFRRVDMHALTALMLSGRRWSEMKRPGAFAVSKSVLVSTTDVRRSNSAAMYLALLSYIENGDQVVSDRATATAIAEKVAPLFLRQGFQEDSSADPFSDYAAMGMGKTPLLFAYESQMVEYMLRPDAARRADMVLLYPSPTILSKSVFIPYTANAKRLGGLLSSDPAIRRAAHRHGYRLSDDAGIPAEWRRVGIAAPDTLIDVVDTPNFETLEAMISVIEGKLR